MIIKGNPVTGAAALGRYLQNAEKNERVTVIEVKGTVAEDLNGALIEMDAYGQGTKCEKALYHGKISPEPPFTLNREQILESVDLLEKRLGLEGHARVIVMHEKDGRQHFHPIWTRIDLNTMKAVPDSHNYRKHEEVSRELERRFGHPRVQGAHAERDHAKRPERTPSLAETRQEERTGIKGKDIRTDVTALFSSCDSAEAFRAALEDNGYLLAKGDRRDFVIVDRAGGIHSLGRRIEGMRAADLREFMEPLSASVHLSAAEARGLQLDRAQGRTNAYDDMKWENALLESALGSERKQKEEKWENRRALEWDDRLIAAAETKAMFEDAAEREWNRKLREGRQEARDDAMIGKAYGSGEDYVHQTGAAVKDHQRRQGDTTQSRPERPDLAKREEDLLRRQADETTRRREAAAETFGRRADIPENRDAHEMTDAAWARKNRAGKERYDDDVSDRDDPDRQREALGGGHTRSR